MAAHRKCSTARKNSHNRYPGDRALVAHRRALHDLGYIEGKNVRFGYRYAKGDNERLPELANDLVSLNVDVILT